MQDESELLASVALAQRVYVQQRAVADGHALALKNQLLEPYRKQRDDAVRAADLLGVARYRIGRVGLGTKATRELYAILKEEV